MEPPGSSWLRWELAVTSKSLDKVTESVVVPVEGLGIAEG